MTLLSCARGGDRGGGLVLDLDVGALTVDPEPAELVGAEIAVLSADDSSSMVWRPGEPAVRRSRLALSCHVSGREAGGFR